MKLTLKISLRFGDDPATPTTPDPDVETQIGTHHDAGNPPTYLGFTNGMESE